MDKSEFYTLKGYRLKEKNKITEAMEDYIEMIYRYTLGKNEIKIKDISNNLNVKPPSVSKMINRLKDLNIVYFERYGNVSLTDKGKEIGSYLLWRHNILKAFFKKINKSYYSLEQVEKIEHFIDYQTILNIEDWIKSN